MTPLARALRKVFAQRATTERPFGQDPVIQGWVHEPRTPAPPSAAPPHDPTHSVAPEEAESPQTRSAELSTRAWAGLVAPAETTDSRALISHSSRILRCDPAATDLSRRDVVWPEPAIHSPLVVWPEICERITRSAAGPALSGIAEQLLAWQQATGGQRILVTGPGRQIGRTATLLALARKLLEHSPLSILLVDAADSEEGWETSHSAAERCDSDSCRDEVFEQAQTSRAPVIQTLVPGRMWGASLSRLREPANETAEFDSPMAGSGSDQLLVLIDGGAWETLDRSTWLRAGVVDGIIEIRRYADQQVDAALDREREAAGIPVLGVIETLAPLVTP